MCHRGVFERALVPECLHTHTCAARSLHVSAPPESAPSNRHDTNVSHLPHMGRNNNLLDLTEFRQPLQVQSHLEMPRILVQLGHTQRT